MRSHLLVLATGLLLSGLTEAHAHALLRRAEPPVGSTVGVSPVEVSLTFSEGVEPRFSTIEVRDDHGVRVDRSDVHPAGDDGRRLAVSLMPLAPGRYGVAWKVVSVDTHRTEGSFAFTISSTQAQAR